MSKVYSTFLALSKPLPSPEPLASPEPLVSASMEGELFDVVGTGLLTVGDGLDVVDAGSGSLAVILEGSDGFLGKCPLARYECIANDCCGVNLLKSNKALCNVGDSFILDSIGLDGT